MYHAKGEANGPISLEKHWIKDKGFSRTPSVVLQLLTQQGLSREDAMIVWLDNLFTEARVLSELREEGIGAAGTVKTSKTQREEDEESHGTKAQKRKAKSESKKGLIPCLAELKTVHNSQLEWGKLYGRLSKDRKVLEFAWKDQNVVLFMTTVHTGEEWVKSKRRRPPKTATNARTSRKVFGELAVKELLITEFIDIEAIGTNSHLKL